MPKTLGQPRRADKWRPRRGIGLILVIALIGVASVMGAAILSASSLQAQVKGNNVRGVSAQYLAESGVNLALYYLQRPENAPVLTANTFYPGQTGVSFGAGVDGNADIAVTAVTGVTDTYDITVTARAGPDPANRTTRQLTVRAYVPRQYVINKAASFRGNFTVRTFITVNGDVRCDGTLTKFGTVNGSIRANSSNAAYTAKPTYPVRACPTMAQLNLYKTLNDPSPYYTYVDGSGVTQIGTPQVLGATLSGTLTPAVSNPMNVWYTDDNLLVDDCNVTGTIVVRGAGNSLTVDGEAHITAMPGMPAVLVDSDILWPGDATTKTLAVNGLLWIGGGFGMGSGPATNCTTVVNGALMMAGGSSTQVDAAYGGTITVNYVAANVNIPNLASNDMTPQSVKIVSWGM